MTLDNKTETQKTINYLLALADALEKGEAALNDVCIESKNHGWTQIEETLTIQYFKVNKDG
ncbi:hypothetical protein FKF61_21550 [Salmonella enterica]|nr:hypothetical protein [Salmonella enterica]EBH2649684.1 hypothetical protein [Salmonella enterica]EHT0126436.1 hypothetical protein [Salmonella enterica]